MKRLVWFVMAAVLVSGAAQAAKVAAALEGSRVVVTVDGALFTAYTFAGTQKYPYFFPVNGPLSGKSVTTETSEPYPHHHSLFFGCDKVNGGNYWQEANEAGQIVSQGPVIAEPEGDRVVIHDRCLWRKPGREPVMRDEREIIITAPEAGLRVVDFAITLIPLVDVVIEKTNHSLFSARMVPELAVAAGGTLVNAEGGMGEKGTFGVASPWCDYFGVRDGVVEGLAILTHPANPWHPAPWFTRDYGFFSPTPMFWPADGKATLLAREKPVRLCYRVVVHGGDTKTADISGIYEKYKTTGIVSSK